jgi:cation-transporting ATPase E
LVVTLVAQSPINAAFGIVVIVNSLIGIFQELRAKRTLDKLAILSAPHARVLRDGKICEIAVGEVVLDDVMSLRLGDQVVADGMILSTLEIEIDESLLTGESDPIAKEVGAEVKSGSFVVAGSAFVRVTAVGEDSYQAKIAAHAKRFQRTPSELIQSTNKLLKWISWMLIIVAPLLVWGQVRIVGLEAWTPAVVRAAAAIVGMIPEGLVLLTSMAFMLAAMALARRNVLVQQMPAVEGLARVDTLLLDKTGTLTEGTIQFKELILLDGGSANAGSASAGSASADGASAAGANAAATNAAAANVSSANAAAANAAAASAIARSALKTIAVQAASPTNDAICEGLKDVEQLEVQTLTPFSSARKWSSVTVTPAATTTNSLTSWILGAPEILLAKRQGNPEQEDAYKQASIIANEGKRVLVLMATAEVPSADAVPHDSHPVALVVLSEKVRDDAGETLGYFAQQGVDIKVISGDSPLTVAAIARAVGLQVDEPFDARDLPANDEQCLQVILSHNVFGRVQPEQKRRIAKLLQGAGRTVAMTGDGVNDAMALKDADIGIAMNSGSSATKAVAELVLMDNRFASLPRVLGEGRRVIANIERVANLFIIKNIYSLALSLAVTVAGQNYPFAPIQMTVISALTIGIPAFFLALAPNQQLYRPGFLKRVLRFAVPVGIISATAMMVGYVLISNNIDAPVVENTAALVHAAHPVASTAVSIITMTIGCWVLVCLARPLKGWKIALIVFVAVAFIALLNIPALAVHAAYQVDLAAMPYVAGVSLVAIALIELVWRLQQAALRKAL